MNKDAEAPFRRFQVTSIGDLDSKLGLIYNETEQFGACIISPWSREVDVFESVALRIGTVQYHIRADANGIVGERLPIRTDWQSAKDAYIGLTETALLPHTDGSYLAGVSVEQGVVRHLDPPALVLLQVVQAAAEGGETILIDCAHVFRDLLYRDSDLLWTLMQTNCLAICRDDQVAAGFPIFRRKRPQVITTRFRFDSKTFIPQHVHSDVRDFVERYIVDSSYCVELTLTNGDILLLDNSRMLHGRRAFQNSASEHRLTRRAWIADKPTGCLVPAIEGQLPDARLLERFDAYRVARQQHTSGLSPTIGIKLNDDDEQRLESLTH